MPVKSDAVRRPRETSDFGVKDALTPTYAAATPLRPALALPVATGYSEPSHAPPASSDFE